MTVRPTRRSFLASAGAGAVAGVTLPPIATASAAPVGDLRPKQKIILRGRAIAVSPHGGRLVIAHDRRRTIAIVTPSRGRSKNVDVGGQPVEVAVSPDGRVAAVTTGFWDKPGLAIVDLHTAKVTHRADVGPAPFGVAFTPSGKRLIVSGGEQEGTVHVLETKTYKVVAKAAIGAVPRGIATVAGSVAWIALNGEDRVVRVNLRTGRVERRVKTPWLPDRVAVSPDGRRLLVSHGGPDADHVSEIEIGSGKLHVHKAGRLPSAVAWTPKGHRLVTLGGSGEVIRLGAGRRRLTRHVCVAPRGLAVAGGRAWTVSAVDGSVSAVRT